MNDATRRAKELALTILPKGKRIPTSVFDLRGLISAHVEPLFVDLEIADRGKRQLMNELSNARAEANK